MTAGSDNSIVNISQTGDVILVSGPAERRLKVSSTVLRNASEVFRAMLGPDFKEGQVVDQVTTGEVPLPEDDADSMQTICNIIHMRNDDVPMTLPPQKVLDASIHAEKYNCVVALKHIFTIWLTQEGVDDVVDLGRLLTSAYIVKHDQAFRNISHKMALIHKGSFMILADEALGLVKFLPWRTFLLLEELRGSRVTALHSFIFQDALAAGSYYPSDCTCGWSAQHALACVEQIQAKRLGRLDIYLESVSEIMARLDGLKDPPMPKGWIPCHYRWHSKPNYRQLRQIHLKTFSTVVGIRLDNVESPIAS